MVFGDAIRRAQVHFLFYIPPNAHILVVGGGTGWIIDEIWKRKQETTFVYIDISSEMIRRAKKLVREQYPTHMQNIEFRTGSLDLLTDTDTFDVVITPFFLDLFTSAQLPGISQRLISVLKQKGIWLFTDFHLPPSQPMRTVATLLIRTMYLFFRVVTHISAKKLPNFDLYFPSDTFTLQEKQYFYMNIIQTKIFLKIV